MRKILILLILFTNYLIGQENFEGEIIFTTEVTTSEFAAVELQKKLEYNYGDTLKVLYNKKGNFIRKYINTGEYGYNYQIYFSGSGNLLIANKGANKIDTLDVTKNSLKLIEKSFVKNKESIMNLDCDCVLYEALDSKKEKIKLEFCYSNEVQKIDPKSFTNHKDYFLDDYFSVSLRPYLKFVLKTKEFSLTFKAFEIIEKELTVVDITKK